MGYGIQLINNTGEEILGENSKPVKILVSFDTESLSSRYDDPNVIGYRGTNDGKQFVWVTGYKVINNIFLDNTKHFFVMVTDYASDIGTPKQAWLKIIGNECIINLPHTQEYGPGQSFKAQISLGVSS